MNRQSATERLRQLYRLCRRCAQDRRALRRMGERDLRDLGITVAELHRELARPFWRDPVPGPADAPRPAVTRATTVTGRNASCLS